MRLEEIYNAAISIGMENDPRGKKNVLQELKRIEKEYQKLNEKEKERFDKEKLTNPYADTRILYGDRELEVQNIMAGIDMDIGEVLAAQIMRSGGERVDLILSHHPAGSAYASFYEVMHMQEDILNKYGIPINVAEDLLRERIKEVQQKVMPVNHQRAVDIARLFDIPMMCIHTPADNCVTTFLQDIMDKKKPRTLGDIIDILNEIPEYKEAIKQKAGPAIFVGSKEKRCGKVFVDMTGGTEGSKNIFEKLSNTEIGTILGMHLSPEHCKEAEKNHINVVIAGHISSDNLGLNLLLDRITRKNKLKIISVSGFRRIER